MRAAPLGLRDGDRERLSALTRASTAPAGMAARARIVLAADGVSHTEIAERVGVSRPTVIGWRPGMSVRAWLGSLISPGQGGLG
jgi:hypothetical protein